MEDIKTVHYATKDPIKNLRIKVTLNRLSFLRPEAQAEPLVDHANGPAYTPGQHTLPVPPQPNVAARPTAGTTTYQTGSAQDNANALQGGNAALHSLPANPQTTGPREQLHTTDNNPLASATTGFVPRSYSPGPLEARNPRLRQSIGSVEDSSTPTQRQQQMMPPQPQPAQGSPGNEQYYQQQAYQQPATIANATSATHFQQQQPTSQQQQIPVQQPNATQMHPMHAVASRQNPAAPQVPLVSDPFHAAQTQRQQLPSLRIPNNQPGAAIPERAGSARWRPRPLGEATEDEPYGLAAEVGQLPSGNVPLHAQQQQPGQARFQQPVSNSSSPSWQPQRIATGMLQQQQQQLYTGNGSPSWQPNGQAGLQHVSGNNSPSWQPNHAGQANTSQFPSTDTSPSWQPQGYSASLLSHPPTGNNSPSWQPNDQAGLLSHPTTGNSSPSWQIQAQGMQQQEQQPTTHAVHTFHIQSSQQTQPTLAANNNLSSLTAPPPQQTAAGGWLFNAANTSQAAPIPANRQQASNPPASLQYQQIQQPQLQHTLPTGPTNAPEMNTGNLQSMQVGNATARVDVPQNIPVPSSTQQVINTPVVGNAGVTTLGRLDVTRVFNWQEKVFSISEVAEAKQLAALQAGGRDQASRRGRNRRSMSLGSQNADGLRTKSHVDPKAEGSVLFTYIHSDDFSEREELKKTVTTSEKEQEAPLFRKLMGNNKLRQEVLKFRAMYIMADLSAPGEPAHSHDVVLVAIKAYPDGSFDMRPGFSKPGKKYRFEDERGAIYEYTVEDASAKAEPTLAKRTAVLQRQVVARAAELRAVSLGLSSFQTPPRDGVSMRLVLLGEIMGCADFEKDHLYAEFVLRFDPALWEMVSTDWAAAEPGVYKGVTAISRVTRYPEDVATSTPARWVGHWSHPIECEMVSKGASPNAAQYPVMIFQVCSLDPHDRYSCQGYTWLDIGSHCPGSRVVTLPCWRPLHSSRDLQQEFFIGGSQELQEPSFVERGPLTTFPAGSTRHHQKLLQQLTKQLGAGGLLGTPQPKVPGPRIMNKYGVRTETTGCVKVRIHCLTQQYDEDDQDDDVDDRQQQDQNKDVGANRSPDRMEGRRNRRHLGLAAVVERARSRLRDARGGDISVRPGVVCDAPAVRLHPGDVHLSEGQVAHFKIQASGMEPMQYQWFKDGKPVQMATSNTHHLILAEVQHLDAGQYHCQVTNKDGTAVSNKATLKVDKLSRVARAAGPVLPEEGGSLSGRQSADPLTGRLSANRTSRNRLTPGRVGRLKALPDTPTHDQLRSDARLAAVDVPPGDSQRKVRRSDTNTQISAISTRGSAEHLPQTSQGGNPPGLRARVGQPRAPTATTGGSAQAQHDRGITTPATLSSQRDRISNPADQVSAFSPEPGSVKPPRELQEASIMGGIRTVDDPDPIGREASGQRKAW